MQHDHSSTATDDAPDAAAHLLLIDDDPADLPTLTAALEGPGRRVTSAASAEAASHLLPKYDFALAVLALRSGALDAARRIRAGHPSRPMPILFVVAADGARALEDAYALGDVAHVARPAPAAVLRAKAAAFVEGRRTAERLRRLERQEAEHRRIESAMRDNEERLRTLSDNLPHGAIYQAVVAPDGSGRFTYFSAGIERLIGVTADEIKQNPMALYGLIHEEDLPRMRAAEEAALHALTPFDCEFRQYTRSGDLRWVHCRSAPRRLPDGGAVWDGVVLDVTDRRRAEEALRRSEVRFRRLFEANIVGVGVSDADGAWREANDELLRIIGFGRDEVWGGQARWLDQTPPEYLPLDETHVAEARRRGACTPYEKEYIRKDGSRVPVLLGYAALDEGRDRYLCFVLDLTPQKRVEAALTEADRRKDEFLAMLAHELRNPLAPVRNAVHILKLLGPADPYLRQAREMIERQVAHMVRLVDDLLDVSRITRGKITLQKEWGDLAAVVARAVETCKPLLDARRHRLTVALPPGPVPVEADLTRLAQVVSNLLNNAAKYTEEGGRIGLTVEPGPGEIVLRVTDSGVGIAADLLPHVFDLFVQGDRSPARTEGGLGIGLTLVKRLVEMHGGAVEANSAGPGRGSEFVLRLPASPAAALPAVGAEPSAAPPAPARRVLIVDDNEDGAATLAMLLREDGHEVRIAGDGPTALAAAAEFRPDFLFLDIGLPRMDGYEIARRIRQNERLKNVFLAALTGYGQDEDRRKSAEAGFDAHLVKPAEPEVLREVLTRSRPQAGG